MTGQSCDHRWKAQRDWMGDPSIPYGTVSWTVWTCAKCGGETTEQPEDWDDPRELAADDERDRRIDEALDAKP